jgi:hypothetical protein
MNSSPTAASAGGLPGPGEENRLSFFSFFPRPGTPPTLDNRLAQWFALFWNHTWNWFPLIQFVGAGADQLDCDHGAAEQEGRDCAFEVFGHFRTRDAAPPIAVPFGTILCPDDNAEFVSGGARFFVPMFLRTRRQVTRMLARLGKLSLFSEDKRKDEGPPRPPVNIDSLAELDRWLEQGASAAGPPAPVRLPPVEKKSAGKARDAGRAAASDEERDTDALTVVLLGDLLQDGLVRGIAATVARCRAAFPDVEELERILREAKKEARPGELEEGLLRSYLANFLEKPTRNLLRRRCGQPVETGNPVARFCQRRQLSFYGPGGIHPQSVGHLPLRDVNQKDKYRLCPVQTPQGHEVGLRLILARRATIDAAKRAVRGPAGDPQPGDLLGEAASLIPFIGHDDAARALMAANMIQQALALDHPQAPLVATEWDVELTARPEVSAPWRKDRAKDGALAYGANLLVGYLPWGLHTYEDGIVLSESARDQLAAVEEETFWLDVRLDWTGQAYEYVEVSAAGGPLPAEGPGGTGDEPAQPVDHLDVTGVAKMNAEVGPGRDLLVRALLRRTPRVKAPNCLEDLQNLPQGGEIVADCSLRYPHPLPGRVVDIRRVPGGPGGQPRRLGVTVRRIIPLEVGDKLAGRHGNKGVVVRILEDTQMPFLTVRDAAGAEQRRHLDVIFNTLGVLGRLNVGQLYETALAKAVARPGGRSVTVPCFDGWGPGRLAEALRQAGLGADDGMEQLYVQEGTAPPRPLSHRCLVGPQYVMRLHHLAGEKVHARAAGKPRQYTARDNQPVRGRRHNGGQRVGEMETWALAAHGAWDLLDDLLALRSDDPALARAARAPDFDWGDDRRRPQALANLVLALRGLGLDLLLWQRGRPVTEDFLRQPRGAAFTRASLDLATPERMATWGPLNEVTTAEVFDGDGTDRFHAGGLFSEAVFGPRPGASHAREVRPWRMGIINLCEAVVNPLASRQMWELFNHPQKFCGKVAGKGWRTELARRLKDAADWSEAPAATGKKGARRRQATRLRGEGRLPKDYLLTRLPVVPPHFREEDWRKGRALRADLNLLYTDVLSANARLRNLRASSPAPGDVDDAGPPEFAEALGRARESLAKAVESLFLGGRRPRGAAFARAGQATRREAGPPARPPGRQARRSLRPRRDRLRAGARPGRGQPARGDASRLVPRRVRKRQPAGAPEPPAVPAPLQRAGAPGQLPREGQRGPHEPVHLPGLQR